MGLTTLSIGRIVRYRCGKDEWPAMVVKKHSVGVSLMVFTDLGAEPVVGPVMRGFEDGEWNWPTHWLEQEEIAKEKAAKKRRAAEAAAKAPAVPINPATP